MRDRAAGSAVESDETIPMRACPRALCAASDREAEEAALRTHPRKPRYSGFQIAQVTPFAVKPTSLRMACQISFDKHNTAPLAFWRSVAARLAGRSSYKALSRK